MRKEKEKHWIGAGEPSVKARPSAGRRFLTRVLIQMGEQLGELSRIFLLERPFFVKPVRKIVDIEKVWCIACTD